ncbi:MAG TPA: glycerophosphodiester phosphodiesterase [Dehalococcoidia bacterium]|nr:glycerophosphodiester phosphodiesterase [Dehalococcoidia bacterium]
MIKTIHLPLIISHRTEMADEPQNSLAGIRAAIKNKADGVEFDVRITKDGVPILAHDANIHEMPNDPLIKTLDFSEVNRFSNSYEARIYPSLSEALSTIEDSISPIVELKTDDAIDAVIAVLTDAPITDRFQIWTFLPSVAAEMRQKLPEAHIALNFTENSLSSYYSDQTGIPAAVHIAEILNLNAISGHLPLLAESSSDVLGQIPESLKLYTWTIREKSDIALALELDVDGLCGDSTIMMKTVIKG